MLRRSWWMGLGLAALLGCQEDNNANIPKGPAPGGPLDPPKLGGNGSANGPNMKMYGPENGYPGPIDPPKKDEAEGDRAGAAEAPADGAEKEKR